MGCTDPCDGVEVYKLRDSPGKTIQNGRRAYVSVFDIALYLERGNTEHEARCSFQCIRDKTYVLSRKQQYDMNEIKEMRDIVKMEQEVQWKCKVAEVTAERDVVKMERDALKTDRDVIKTERDGLLAEIDRLKRTELTD
ncbi:hypothetical protein NPIL_480031 [Nephila pilipes]|uniref:Uncharacterized protein n=1 Tax=Nephila pilipes TaxID=299642 RepID=A0A8X6UKT2_NEPPI|nr:hypothetical protein NPIL_480031 [Nephila pilipes]